MLTILLSFVAFTLLSVIIIALLLCQVDKKQRDDWDTPNDTDEWDK